MEKRQNVAQDIAGNRIPQATITITEHPGGAIATIYSDNAGTSKANPFISDTNGNYEYYAADGRYTETAAKTGYTTEQLIDVFLFDGSQITKTSKAEAAALTLAPGDAGTKVFITSADGGPGTIRYDAGGGHSDDDPTYCGNKFIINGDPTIYWERDDVVEISPLAFGAVGDGSTVMTQNALDYISTLGDGGVTAAFRRSGGTLSFPNGTFKTTAALDLLPGVYELRGTRRFKTYAQIFDAQPDCPTTIMPVHLDRDCITIAPGSQEVALTMLDLNIATIETGDRPTAALGFDVTGAEFQRDFLLERVCLQGFTSAIDVYGATGIQSIGTLHLNQCAINRNTNILRCLNTTLINVLKITNCELGQNSNGMDLRGHAITIRDSVLESVPNAIKISGSYRAGVIEGNYFESNSGDYVIFLNDTRGFRIGPNFAGTITATNHIKLLYDVDTVVDESDLLVCPEGSFNLKTRNNLISPVDDSYASVALYWDESLNRDKYAYGGKEVTNASISPSSNIGPHAGIQDSVGYRYTTTGTGIIAYTKSNLSIASGDWVVAGMLVTYDDEVAVPPRFYMRPNSSDTNGHIAIFYEWDGAKPGTKGKTVLYFGLLKAVAALTTYQFYMYPYGLNPAAGLRCIRSQPFIMNMGTSLPGPRGDSIQPFIPKEWFTETTGVPTGGTWRLGQKVLNKDPLATEWLGWACQTNGTFSAATDNTGDTDGSTAVITGMTDTSDFYVGEFVTVSLGFPSAVTPYEILALTATSVTLDTNSNSVQTNVTVATVDPTFKGFGVVET